MILILVILILGNLKATTRATRASLHESLMSNGPARALYSVILKLFLTVLYNSILDYVERVGFYVEVVVFLFGIGRWLENDSRL